MIEIKIINNTKVIKIVIVLWLLSFLILIILIYTANSLAQQIAASVNFILTIAMRFIKRFKVVGNAKLQDNRWIINIEDKIIDVPLENLKLSIDSYKNQPVNGIWTLTNLEFWKSGDGNYLHIDESGKKYKLEFLIEDKIKLEKLKSIKTAHNGV